MVKRRRSYIDLIISFNHLNEDGNAVNGGQGQGGGASQLHMPGGGGAGHGEYHKCAF